MCAGYPFSGGFKGKQTENTSLQAGEPSRSPDTFHGARPFGHVWMAVSAKVAEIGGTI